MKVTITQTGAWLAAHNAVSTNITAAVRVALRREAEFMADKVRDALKNGPHEKLSPLTLRARRLGIGGPATRGTKPLLRTGDLYNSIAATPDMTGDAFFVGISRSVRSRTGESLVRLADVHERGRTIVMKMTPKMIRFLFGVLLKGVARAGGGGGASGGAGGGTKILVIHIPARPFIGPAFTEWSPTSLDRFRANLAAELKGVFGG